MTGQLIEPLTQPCGICGGRGAVPRDRRRLPNGELDPFDTLNWPEIVCDACNGTGQIALQPEATQKTPA
jgi:hypothetical protein